MRLMKMNGSFERMERGSTMDRLRMFWREAAWAREFGWECV